MMMVIAEKHAAMGKGFLLLIMFGHNSSYGVLNDTSCRSRSMRKKARKETSGGGVHVWCCRTAKVHGVVGMKCQQTTELLDLPP